MHLAGKRHSLMSLRIYAIDIQCTSLFFNIWIYMWLYLQFMRAIVQWDLEEHVKSRNLNMQDPFVQRRALVIVCEDATDHGHETPLHFTQEHTPQTLHWRKKDRTISSFRENSVCVCVQIPMGSRTTYVEQTLKSQECKGLQEGVATLWSHMLRRCTVGHICAATAEHKISPCTH